MKYFFALDADYDAELLNNIPQEAIVNILPMTDTQHKAIFNHEPHEDEPYSLIEFTDYASFCNFTENILPLAYPYDWIVLAVANEDGMYFYSDYC